MSTESSSKDQPEGPVIFTTCMQRPHFECIVRTPVVPFDDADTIDADPYYFELFAAAIMVEHDHPHMGTTLHGTRLSKLNKSQREKLERLARNRGYVRLRDSNVILEGDRSEPAK